MRADKAAFSLLTDVAMAAIGPRPSQPPASAGSPQQRRGADSGLVAQLARLSDAAGQPTPQLMADFAALSLGPGRVAITDYERLRLFDQGFWGPADRREVVGARRGRELAFLANPRREAFALATDRLASGAYLGAHGLVTVPTIALYRADLASPGANLLRSKGELREFLGARTGQPLVAQPAEGGRPRLLFAGQRHDAGGDVERLIAETGDLPGVTWLLQPLVPPHPSYAGLTGGRLAPVQFLTLASDDGVQVDRAVWRLGGRDDLVASLDLATGRALELFPAREPYHRQTAPADLVAPGWSLLRAAVTEAARLFSQFGLLGLEVAPSADGPVILGLDPTPDLDLPQLADRRGLLTARVQAFLADRRRLAGG